MTNNNIITSAYHQAVTLNSRIKSSLVAAQEQLITACLLLKEMRDGKKYKELGYENFDDYCDDEIGLKRRMVYNMISVVEKLPADFVQLNSHLGVTKLTLLSSLTDEERDIVTTTVNVEDSTVKKLKDEIKRLKSDIVEKQADIAKDNLRIKNLSEKIVTKDEYIDSLCSWINDLRNNPVDVAVVDNSAELEDLNEQIEILKEDLEIEKSKHESEIEKIKAYYERAIADIKGGQLTVPEDYSEPDPEPEPDEAPQFERSKIMDAAKLIFMYCKSCGGCGYCFLRDICDYESPDDWEPDESWIKE